MKSVEQVLQLYHTSHRTCGKFCLVFRLSTKHHIVDTEEILFHQKLKAVELTDWSGFACLTFADCFKHYGSTIHSLCISCIAYGNGKVRVINQFLIPCLYILPYIGKFFCRSFDEFWIFDHKIILQSVSLIIIRRF